MEFYLYYSLRTIGGGIKNGKAREKKKQFSLQKEKMKQYYFPQSQYDAGTAHHITTRQNQIAADAMKTNKMRKCIPNTFRNTMS